MAKKKVDAEEPAALVKTDVITTMIYVVRGQKVMLDSDLAALYGVETKQLKRAVRRNEERFPSDFMFDLTDTEHDSLRCQFGTLKRGEHSKYPPFVFTEQGVSMLSSVLNSARAIQVNIAIMRIFARLREMVSTYKELAATVAKLEEKFGRHDNDIRTIIELIRRLHSEPEKEKSKIGFHP